MRGWWWTLSSCEGGNFFVGQKLVETENADHHLEFNKSQNTNPINPKFVIILHFLLDLSKKAAQEPAEKIIDILIGSAKMTEDEPASQKIEFLDHFRWLYKHEAQASELLTSKSLACASG